MTYSSYDTNGVLCISVHAEAIIRLKDQLDEALQREEVVKTQLESEKRRCEDAYSRLDRLQKAEVENEEIKVAASRILHLFSGLSENETSQTLCGSAERSACLDPIILEGSN